uniref:DUF5641 domain-containing protein n=1 Tax=Heterorhabditis bacteriophora TaxID=37862 RepID=A0A1I7X9P7_HETBA
MSLRGTPFRGLRQRKECMRRSTTIREIVVVNEPNIKRRHWRLARVTRTISSKDCAIRTVEVKFINDRQCYKSIPSIYPLEISNAESNESEDYTKKPNEPRNLQTDDERTNPKRSTPYYNLRLHPPKKIEFPE